MVRMGQTSTPQSDKLLCGMVMLGRCCCARPSRSVSIFLTAPSASAIAWDQREYVSAQIEIVATGRRSPPHDLSSFIDIVRFE